MKQEWEGICFLCQNDSALCDCKNEFEWDTTLDVPPFVYNPPHEDDSKLYRKYRCYNCSFFDRKPMLCCAGGDMDLPVDPQDPLCEKENKE